MAPGNFGVHPWLTLFWLQKLHSLLLISTAYDFLLSILPHFHSGQQRLQKQKKKQKQKQNKRHTRDAICNSNNDSLIITPQYNLTLKSNVVKQRHKLQEVGV